MGQPVQKLHFYRHFSNPESNTLQWAVSNTNDRMISLALNILNDYEKWWESGGSKRKYEERELGAPYVNGLPEFPLAHRHKRSFLARKKLFEEVETRIDPSKETLDHLSPGEIGDRRNVVIPISFKVKVYNHEILLLPLPHTD